MTPQTMDIKVVAARLSFSIVFGPIEHENSVFPKRTRRLFFQTIKCTLPAQPSKAKSVHQLQEAAVERYPCWSQARSHFCATIWSAGLCRGALQTKKSELKRSAVPDAVTCPQMILCFLLSHQMQHTCCHIRCSTCVCTSLSFSVK